MQPERKEKIKSTLKKIASFLLNPHLLLCFGIAWFITNGWCYVFMAVGGWLDIGWMFVAGSTWAVILWFPCTPEKIITVIIAIFLLRLLFPNDERTLLVLREEQKEAKRKWNEWRAKRREKKAQKQQRKADKKKSKM